MIPSAAALMMAFTAETALPTAAPQAVFESTRVQTLSHTELLNGESHNLWEACKHAVALLPDLAPEYFARAEFEKGWGGPGSIGVFHFGPGKNNLCYLEQYAH